MKTVTAIFLASMSVGVLCGCTTVSNRFALVSEATGKEYGPFFYRNSRNVEIDGKQYRIKELASTDRLLVQKLRDTIIPAIDFRDVDVRDAVAFFRESGLIDDYRRAHAPPCIIELVLPNSKEVAVPKVTLEMKGVSMWKALEVVAEVTGLDLSVEDGHVWLKY